jgi:hypothetical protein
MKYLFAAACTLAMIAGPSAQQAHAKAGGAARNARAAVAPTNVPTVTVRDHRGRFGDKGGGVRVCNHARAPYCIIRH